MYGKRRFNGVPFFEPVQEILAHYSCPSTCPAICCKIADINLDEEDLKLLRQAPKYKADKIESWNEDGKHYYKMNPPCPFLDLDKCSVYDHRPAMCRMFPFNISIESDVLLLFPCDMGSSIFGDYVQYSYSILKQPVPEKTINSFEESHCSFENRLNEGLPIPMLAFKPGNLIPFEEYLKARNV